MAPLKKSKKAKKKKPKLGSKKCGSSKTLLPLEPKSIDSDWWNAFRLKNSNTGIEMPDEEEGFKYFFRLSRKTFDYICSLVRQDLVSRPPSGLINIEGRLLSVEKQVAIALRRLASAFRFVGTGICSGIEGMVNFSKNPLQTR